MAIERKLVIAAGGMCRLRVKYVSINSGKSRWREMVPRTFGWDGRRWYLRAFCCDNEEWSDFVSGRFEEAEEAEWPGAAEEVPDDEAWDRWVVVKLKINPDLDAMRRRDLRLDYRIDGKILEVRVREAMKPYLLAEMFLEEENGEKLPRHFVLKR
ncbi:MAG: WYL domain-containing protein [Verrucomicrobiales bacterium]